MDEGHSLEHYIAKCGLIEEYSSVKNIYFLAKLIIFFKYLQFSFGQVQYIARLTSYVL